MSNRLDPALHREIAGFGGVDVDACISCGNCTAICSLSSEANAFPRRTMHYLQIGNREKLLSSPDAWLCYFCGDCSESCPRDANPGETMMATRRWLTARYDWTGIGRKLYLSTAWEIAALTLVAAFVVALFTLFHGPVITERVEVNTFAPVAWVERGDLVMAGLLSIFLLSNAFRMYRWIMRADGEKKVPLALYARAVPTFVTHFLSQRRWHDFGDRRRWLRHLLLVSGYLTMLTLILVLLRWFQTDVVHAVWHPQRLLGYYATAVLLWSSASMIISRVKKDSEMHRHSEPSDWIFLLLLFFTALTGILLHGFRLAGLPLATYTIYVVHMAIAVPMLVVEVPFGKWAHLFYRPLALFLMKVKELARETTEKQGRATAA